MTKARHLLRAPLVALLATARRRTLVLPAAALLVVVGAIAAAAGTTGHHDGPGVASPAAAGGDEVAEHGEHAEHGQPGQHDPHGSAAAGPATGATGGGHAHARDYEAIWSAASAQERAGATALLEATRAGIGRFRDVDVARAEGYAPHVDRPDATHYANPRYSRDGVVLDPEHPESLVYRTTRDGRKALMAALFKAHPGQAAPAPGGELTMWHVHPGVGQRCYPAEDTSCPDRTRMLHVYVFDGAVDPFTESMVAAAGGRAALRR